MVATITLRLLVTVVVKWLPYYYYCYQECSMLLILLYYKLFKTGSESW